MTHYRQPRRASDACAVIAIAILIANCSPASPKQATPTADTHIRILPTGKLLDPVGRTIGVGNMPLSIAVAPGGRYAVVLLSGWREQGVQIVDLTNGTVLESHPQKSAFLGLAFSPDGKSFYASGAAQNAVYRYDWQDGHSRRQTTISLGPPDSLLEHARIAAGIAFSPDGRWLYVAENMSDSLAVIEAATGRVVQHLHTSHYPYGIVVDPSGRLFVSAWGASSIDVFAPGSDNRLRASRSIEVGRHPSALILNKDSTRLFAALSGTDQIAIVDTKSGVVISTLSDAALAAPREGSTPNALVLSNDGSRLYVAEADNNAVALFDLSANDAGSPTSNSTTALAGRIPVLWYPTALAMLGDTLLVVSGKGRGTGPNPTGPRNGLADTDPRTYTLGQLDGTISVIDANPSASLLAQFSARVAHANNWDRQRERPAYPPFEHAILIIKENRTYDQVLSDIPAGDGDTSLVFFPRSVSPNHHSLAERFGLYDRFFTNAEVSSQGHPWSVSAYVTEYTEKTVPSLYSDRRAEADEGEVDEPSTGYLWSAAAGKGLVVRDYGEYAAPEPSTAGTDGASRPAYRPVKPSLAPFLNTEYPSFDMSIPDQRRADAWIAEFDRFVATGKMPALEILHLPGDHTAGTRPGLCTPKACMADNDLALGRIIQSLSRSPFWKNTVVFVVEDDAQAGPDHVDSHRSVLLVVSVYSKAGMVHRFVNTTDVLATIEEILGIAPLSQFDRFGRPLHDVWAAQPNLAPYMALLPHQSIMERNPPRGVAAAESQRLDLSAADRIDDNQFNRLLWRAIKGKAPFPTPRRSSTLDYVRDR